MSSDTVSDKYVLLERILRKYTEDFAQKNVAAGVLMRGLSLVGVGMRPLLDHFVFRTLHPKERAQEFLELGYEKDPETDVFCGKAHETEVYRNGCAPSVLIQHSTEKADQEWVKRFGDQAPFVLAVRVEDIDEAAFRLEKQAVAFLRPSAGKKGDSLRQIAAMPTADQGLPHNYLTLVERHRGDRRFYLPGPCEQSSATGVGVKTE
ncbi:MAG: hypothetical protein KTQ49_04620 [Candidatus Omnitrophica bacterium]|nr:hypothetical protein [Candidatus Omnitrophota bacterium]